MPKSAAHRVRLLPVIFSSGESINNTVKSLKCGKQKFWFKDCLDPPLTALPTGLWMCPNHPEHFIDWKMVSSISATERVKLWDEFSKPVDQEAVKADFLRRVQRKNQPLRMKLKAKPRICAEIPQMVEYHYKNPPPFLPSLRDVLRCEKVYNRGMQYNTTNAEICEQLGNDLQAFDDANKKLESYPNGIEEISAIDEDENSVGNDENLGATTPSLNENEEVDERGAESEATKESDVEEIQRETKTLNEEQEEKKEHIKVAIKDTNEEMEIEINSELEKPKLETGIKTDGPSKPDSQLEEIATTNAKSESTTSDAILDSSTTITINGNDSPPCQPKRKRTFSLISNVAESVGSDLPSKISALETATHKKDVDTAKIDRELEHLDAAIIKQLAFQQLQQLINENPDLVTKYQIGRANDAISDALQNKPKTMVLPSQILSQDDITSIAQQFLSCEMLIETGTKDNPLNDLEKDKYPVLPFVPPPTDAIFYTNGLNHIEDEIELTQAIARRLEQPISNSKIRARAVLTPVDDILRGDRYISSQTTNF